MQATLIYVYLSWISQIGIFSAWILVRRFWVTKLLALATNLQQTMACEQLGALCSIHLIQGHLIAELCFHGRTMLGGLTWWVYSVILVWVGIPGTVWGLLPILCCSVWRGGVGGQGRRGEERREGESQGIWIGRERNKREEKRGQGILKGREEKGGGIPGIVWATAHSVLWWSCSVRAWTRASCLQWCAQPFKSGFRLSVLWAADTHSTFTFYCLQSPLAALSGNFCSLKSCFAPCFTDLLAFFPLLGMIGIVAEDIKHLHI